MPCYEYECPNGHKFDKYLRMADYKQPQPCECGELGNKLFSPATIVNSFESYESPIDGSVISTPAKRREDLARSGSVPYEPGMRQDADTRAKESEVKLEREMDNTVDRLLSEMPSRKREKLESELSSGANISYERQGG